MKLRRISTSPKNPDKPSVYGFALPAHLMPAISNMLGAEFDAELTNEGILFRFIRKPNDRPDVVDIPDWAK